MKRVLLLLGCMCLCVLAASPQVQNKLEVYPAPSGVEMKNDFTVKVRIPEGEWKPVDTYMVKVDEVRDTKHCVEKASLAYFDFEGEVEVGRFDKELHSSRICRP